MTDFTEKEIQEKFLKTILIIFGDFFKVSAEEKKLTTTDLSVYIHCLKSYKNNSKIDIKNIAKVLGKSQITISRSLIRLKSVKAIDRDFIPTDKFLNSNILNELEEEEKNIKNKAQLKYEIDKLNAEIAILEYQLKK